MADTKQGSLGSDESRERAVSYWIHIIKAASAAHRKRSGGSESIGDFEAEALAEAIYRDPLYGNRWGATVADTTQGSLGSEPTDSDRITATSGPPNIVTCGHKTPWRYSKGRCRCDGCRTAWADYMAARRFKRRQQWDCPHCGGPGGLFREGLCGACHDYEVRNGRKRPEHLWGSPRSAQRSPWQGAE